MTVLYFTANISAADRMRLLHVYSHLLWYKLFDACTTAREFGQVERMMMLCSWKEDKLYSVLLDEPTESGCVPCDIDGRKVYLIPCFLCVVLKTKGVECEYIWVHPDCRNKGYGKFLLNGLNVKYGTEIPNASRRLWERSGYTVSANGTAVTTRIASVE